MLTKIEMFQKFRPKLWFVKKKLTENKIFDISQQNREFDHNRDFRKVWPNARFTNYYFFYWNQDFQKFERSQDFSKLRKIIEIFRKFWPSVRFFKNSVIRQDFLKFFTKIVIFKIFWQIKISYNLTKIEIFENFDQNRCFFKVLTKINSFENFDKHRDFSNKNSKVEIFPGISNKFEIFHKISEKIVIFRQFSSIKINHNFHQIGDDKKWQK